MRIRENAKLVTASEAGEWSAEGAQVATLEGAQAGPSGILGADGKPMTPIDTTKLPEDELDK